MVETRSTDRGWAAYAAVPLAAAAGLLGVALLFGGLLGFVFGAYGLAATRDIVLASCAASSLSALLYYRAQRDKHMDQSGHGG